MHALPRKKSPPSLLRQRPSQRPPTLKELADAWNSLTPAQRQAWQDYADQENRRKLRLPPKGYVFEAIQTLNWIPGNTGNL